MKDKNSRSYYDRITGSDTRVFNEIPSKTKVWRWWCMVTGRNNPLRINPLLVLLIFGLAGVLLDLDHFIIQQLQMVRPLHLPYWFISGVFCIGYSAYLYRRVHKTGLKEGA